MTRASRVSITVFAAMLLCATEAAAAERADEGRIGTFTTCDGRAADGACIGVAKQGGIFCIAEDRCSTIVPRPVSALVRYDAKMDAMRQR